MAVEKEINIFLLAHRQALMRVLEVYENGGDVEKAIKKEIENVDAMLYQKPPLID